MGIVNVDDNEGTKPGPRREPASSNSTTTATCMIMARARAEMRDWLVDSRVGSQNWSQLQFQAGASGSSGGGGGNGGG